MQYERSAKVAALALVLVASSLVGGIATPALADTVISGPGTITAYAYRITSSYWEPTFTTTNAQMYFVVHFDRVHMQ